MNPPKSFDQTEFLEQRATEHIASFSLGCQDEERERKLFMDDLNKFMAEVGKPLSKIPIMGYKELDLFQLFHEVTAYGGFNEVVKNVGTWSKIWKRLANFDPSITDSSFRLKKNYERYLLEYEYKCLPEHRRQALDIEKQTQKKADGSSSPKTDRKKTKKNSSKNNNISSMRLNEAELQNITFPLTLGSVTIESLGSIIPRHPFVTDKHIWPVGFQSYRYFTSMVDPSKRVKYTCLIREGEDKPEFVIIAEDDPFNAIISHSPSGAWRMVLKNIAKNESIMDEKKCPSVSGASRFGLTHPTVVSLLRNLPNAQAQEEMKSAAMWSPSSRRKRKSSSDEHSSSEESSESSEQREPKSPREYPNFSFDDESFLSSTEELDAIECAVQTLNALKFCGTKRESSQELIHPAAVY